jgi:hypothetical protein
MVSLAVAWVAAIPAILSLASSLYGQVRNAKAGKEQQKLIEQQQNDLSAWYKNNYYKDFLQTDVAKSVLSKLINQFTDQANLLNNVGAKTGATHETNLAGKSALNKQYAAALAELLGMGTQYKDSVRRSYLYQYNPLMNYQMGSLANKQASWANFGGNAVSSLANLYEAFAPNGSTGGDVTSGASGFKSVNTMPNQTQNTYSTNGCYNAVPNVGKLNYEFPQ